MRGWTSIILFVREVSIIWEGGGGLYWLWDGYLANELSMSMREGMGCFVVGVVGMYILVQRDIFGDVGWVIAYVWI